jgi:hypothetical protein
MQRLHLGRGALGLWAGLALCWTPQVSLGQQAKPERVRFETVDKVEIHGTYYASDKKNEAPCALLLHPVTGTSQLGGWDSLALALQKKGFAVLTFDFRGHGGSKNVEKTFWLNPVNQRGIKTFSATNPREKIDFKDFNKSYYYPYLINDIAAAKEFLDNRNDQGECNSANLVLIGADTGATLGALWLREECCRYRVIGGGLQPQADTKPEGKKDVVCAVWLSINPSLGGSQVSPSHLLTLPGQMSIPMAFVYGDGDSKGKQLATTLFRRMKAFRDAPKLTGAQAIEKAGKLTGEKLLRSSLGTEDWIVKYADSVIAQTKGLSPYKKRLNDRTPFIWKLPTGRTVICRRAGDESMMFIPADQFLQ